MDFRQTIKDFARGATAILEIGPSYNPIAPKSEGFNVTVMDHVSQEELRAKYKHYPVDVNRIEEVDVIATDLEVLRGRRFSCIIASHLIEHTTDFVRFLQSCSRLLTSDGKLLLIVPDKRYCFDFHRPPCTTGQILDAYVARKSQHHGAVFDQFVSAASRGVSAWEESNEAPLTFIHTFEEADSFFKSALQSSEYTDAHAWTFTPSSFRLIVQDLGRLDLIDLFEADFHPSFRGEFFISLSQHRPLTSVPRAELLSAIAREQFSVTEEYRAMHRRLQELEAREGELATLRALIRELRAHLGSLLPKQGSSLRSKVSRRLRRLLELARAP